MPVSPEIRRALYQRAGGRCECRMRVCSHHAPGTRCTHSLSGSSWEAHHRTAGGPDTLSNLIAMCATCHKNTRTYGRS
jgi:HNH endonuclease